MGFEEKNSEVTSSLKCTNCGASLVFKPGTDTLVCPYCGTENHIGKTEDDAVHSYDYDTFIAENDYRRETDVFTVKCDNCGATTTLDENVTAATCPFCDSALVIAQKKSGKMLQPHYVLPFLLDEKKALSLYKTWIGKLWFAPDKLVKNVNDTQTDKVVGMYLPYWSFDMDTQTEYSGSRGEYYWVEERYYETVNGQQEERTREVRRTRWYPVDGTVDCEFDDVLVAATNSLQSDIAEKLEPWSLDRLKPYQEKYLSGFRSELFQVEPPDALQRAKSRVDDEIKQAIYSDIGGDEQRIDTYESAYQNIALKYDLLPIWITAFHFEGKVYQIVVNGSTGEVIGERPYSASKIIFAVLIALIVIIAIYFFAKGNN